MTLRGWKPDKPLHPGWCRVVEAHNREDCATELELVKQHADNLHRWRVVGCPVCEFVRQQHANLN